MEGILPRPKLPRRFPLSSVKVQHLPTSCRVAQGFQGSDAQFIFLFVVMWLSGREP